MIRPVGGAVLGKLLIEMCQLLGSSVGGRWMVTRRRLWEKNKLWGLTNGERGGRKRNKLAPVKLGNLLDVA